jgi:membrane-bound serine protease (ClpP class)
MEIWRRLLVAWLLGLACTQALAAPRTAMVIALDGAIGPGSASYVVRSLNEAQRQDAAVVVLRMDTPGGLDSAMRDIIRVMLASPVPVIAYVAPGGARGASAGTYILYAAALAAMAPGTIWVPHRRFPCSPLLRWPDQAPNRRTMAARSINPPRLRRATLS